MVALPLISHQQLPEPNLFARMNNERPLDRKRLKWVDVAILPDSRELAVVGGGTLNHPQ